MTVIDYQTHWYPVEYLESIRDRDRWPRTVKEGATYVLEQQRGVPWRLGPSHTDLTLALGDMDANGVDVMVCSPNTLGEVAGLELAEATATTQLLNDELARAERAHPARFVGLAMLPVQDADAAVTELDRAIGTLGLRGVCMLSSSDGQRLATPASWPIFERIAELGVPLFLHPPHRSMTFGAGFPFGVELGLSWMVDTSALALDLIFSGFLDRSPELTIVAPHLGGVLPYVIGRLENVGRATKLPRSLTEYLRTHFYTDTGNTTPGAIALASATYGFERILLATDFPWVPRSMTLEYLDAELGSEAAAKLRHEHALPGLLGEQAA
jgi:aminocarboxymuconate-semialdehyde decarboxylase